MNHKWFQFFIISNQCTLLSKTVLGFLKALDSRINGLTGTESNPVKASNPTGPRYTVTHTAVDVDPGIEYRLIFPYFSFLQTRATV